ncbi:FecR family protein [Pseudomonas sp. GD03944]|uniref:FecR family protein n=1 Tax=Pseudomonas sp. GD03944 TaxID=2975409 RepID=UPI002449A0D8|nr:FecR family protein [Pseudomonas sp. GD03944]MDH1265793.1 FecR family protein [Pseudomonas sp. GD03944]
MSHSPLLAQAREWQVLLNSGRATAADRENLDAWRNAAPEHEQAMRQVEDLWALLGQVQRPAEPAVVTPIASRRRGLARWSVPLASAALLLLALWLPQGTWVGLYADMHTAPGERREVQLEDGSTLTLNGDTALDWRVSGDRREVHLYHGEADFQVAADSTRPFLVSAGAMRIRVTGTRFDVNHSGDRVDLAVTHGHVQVGTAQQPNALAVQAGQQVQWRDGDLQAVQPLDAQQRLAWQRGKLVFRDRPLAEVFDELERSQGDRVVFLDDQARRLQVTGVFPLDDPDAVLRAVADTLPVRLVRLPGLILVSARD